MIKNKGNNSKWEGWFESKVNGVARHFVDKRQSRFMSLCSVIISVPVLLLNVSWLGQYIIY